MFLNVFKIRIALVIAGLVVMIAYFAIGGSFGSKSSIAIEFGMYPEEFEGLEVEIDGEVVGVLEKFGQATRTAFSVKDGRHTVRVLHPEYQSREETVTTGVGGQNVMLILDLADVSNELGGADLALVFQ